MNEHDLQAIHQKTESIYDEAISSIAHLDDQRKALIKNYLKDLEEKKIAFLRDQLINPKDTQHHE